MIRIVTGSAVCRLMEMVAANPAEYRRLVVCSPFVDNDELERLVVVSLKAVQAGCRSCVITRPEVATRIREQIRLRGTPRKTPFIYAKINLHAKVYLAASVARFRSKAIVTSAKYDLGRVGSPG